MLTISLINNICIFDYLNIILIEFTIDLLFCQSFCYKLDKRYKIMTFFDIICRKTITKAILKNAIEVIMIYNKGNIIKEGAYG